MDTLKLETDIRMGLHDVMRETLKDDEVHHNWKYVAARPEGMPTATRAYKVGARVVGDCSKGCQYLDWWTPHSPDCMGNNFSPFGNSQTICFHLHHLAGPSDLWVGDVVTFGAWGNEHAARVLEKGPDPLMWSFGHQGAPNTYKLSWDKRPKQYLRAQIAAIPMTPQEHLRAMTGWFAWVAWKLGEGPWVHYGKSNMKVRPNVPRLIPKEWWIRLGQFVANRNKGNEPTTQHLSGR